MNNFELINPVDNYITIRYKCKICSFESESKKDVKKHIKETHGDVLKCLKNGKK